MSCKKVFTRKDKLSFHEKTHMEKENLPHNHVRAMTKLFLCSYCPKRYTRKQHLENHERSHDGTLSHLCKYCGHKFWRSDHLESHKALNNFDEKIGTCVCLVCGVQFLYDQLKKHMT